MTESQVRMLVLLAHMRNHVRRRLLEGRDEGWKMEFERRWHGFFLSVGDGSSQQFWESLRPRVRQRKLRAVIRRLLHK
jgi:hypothetical protein